MSLYRKKSDLKRRRPIRRAYDRVLVVCEGSKTEPNYFDEIRLEQRLQTTFIRVLPSELGTDPLSVVNSALQEFDNRSKAFEKVFAVFDRDDHQNYANAIHKAMALNNNKRMMKNDEGATASFEAIVTVPSFELWLLLHFANIQAWLHRDEVLQRLRTHIGGYEKGMDGIFARTKANLQLATDRGTVLKATYNRIPGNNEPYTDVHELVKTLLNLKSDQT